MKNTNCEKCSVSHLSIFSKIQLDDKTYISDKKSCFSLKKGTPIFCSGTRPTGIYCLKSGKIKIHVFGSIKEHIMRFVMPGHFFGLCTLFTGNYNCCATALEDVTICKINTDDFLNILCKYPPLLFQVITDLGQQLEFSHNKIISLAEKTVRQRLAEGLISIYKTFYGEFSDTNSDNSNKEINLSRKDISNLIDTSSESVIRLLSEFKNEGYITIKGRSIFLKNIKELIKIEENF